MSDIIFKDVSFAYPNGFVAVDNISFNIESGENVAIIGQNGAGKTTTVKMINGLLKPSNGDVLVGGKNTKDYTTAQMSRVAGYVFQNPDDQIFHSSIIDEVSFGPLKMDLSEKEVKERVDEALELTGLADSRKRRPYDLPLSVRKFITIASIIAMRTDVLIFDEPTAGQDLLGNEMLEKILVELTNQGKTLITISHDMEFVARNFDKVIVMSDKKVLKSGNPNEVFWDFDVLTQADLKQPFVSRVCRALGLQDIVSIDEAVNAIMNGE